MLRIVANQHAAGAKEYFTGGLAREDYYTGTELTPGHWFGEGAKLLGLQGDVDRKAFAALCENSHPSTGEQLTPRTKTNRRVAYDFNFHCPKSVSLLHALNGDERILRVFQDCVRETMTDIERHAETRVRRGGQSTDRATGNLVWSEFTHFTARPIDGIPDPHLHAHCFVFNLTHDGVEGIWKAAQFGGIKRHAPFFESLFLSRLAAGLGTLGYETEPKGKFWEVKDFPASLVEKFSRRTVLIEKTAAARGIDSPEEKASLGARTRRTKREGLTGQALLQAWRDRLTGPELKALDGFRERPAIPRGADASREAISFVMERSFERAAVVSVKALFEDALRFAPGRVTLAGLEAELKRRDVIRREVNGEAMVTTKEVLREEKRMVDMATRGRGEFSPIRSKPLPADHAGLNAQQLAAANHVLMSKDFVTIIEGRAGTGKTTLTKCVVEEIEKKGRSVTMLAPTAKASRGVLRGEGFKKANTLSKFLTDPDLQKRAIGGVVIVDEAGLIGTQTMLELQQVCRPMNARIFLSGDSNQHGSIARGNCLRVLREFAGLGSAVVEEIQRQKGEFKRAVEFLSTGRVDDGFACLDKLGAIKVCGAADAPRSAAKDFVESMPSGKKTLMVAPTHAEGDAVTSETRALLSGRGKLGKSRTFDRLTALDSTAEDRSRADFYTKGQVVQFHQNVKGFRAGSRWNVIGTDPFGNIAVRDGLTMKALPLKHAEEFAVFEKSTIDVAVGDAIRITRNGKTNSIVDAVFNEATGLKRRPKRDLDNGLIQRVKRFTKDGDIQLANGLVVSKDFGHLDYGYCVTSRGSQGATVDHLVLLETKASGRAASAEQFYVSVSRAKESVSVYTDDKVALMRAVSRSSMNPSAMDLAAESKTDRERERRSDVANEQLRAQRERDAKRDREDRDRDR